MRVLGNGAGGAATFRSLRNRNFRLYVGGQLVSVTGTNMQLVAQSWLVLDLTGSGTALGLVSALQFLPMLLFGVWGGLLADRLDKRRLLMFSQAAGGVLALLFWALIASGAVTLWMVYALAFLAGCAWMVDMPARQSFTIEMVGPADVSNAVALNSATFNSGRLLGPAAAGVLIASVGVAVCFLVNAVSFLATIAALVAMRPDELIRQAPVPREPGQVRAGLRYVWRTPALRAPLLLVTVLGTFGFNFVVVLPLLATESFGGGSQLYGLMTALMGLGALLGALVAARRIRPTRRILLGSAAAFGAFTTVAAAAPTAGVAAVLLVAMGASMMTFLATANSTLQLAAEPSLRGRVMALYGLVFLGSTPVGGPIVGWVAEHWGARAGVALGGVASLAAAVVAAVPILRARRARALEEAVAATGAPGPLAPTPGGGLDPRDPVEAA